MTEIINLSDIEKNLVCGGIQELYKEEFPCEGISSNSTVTTCYSVRPVECKVETISKLSMAVDFLTSPRVVLIIVLSATAGFLLARAIPRTATASLV